MGSSGSGCPLRQEKRRHDDIQETAPEPNKKPLLCKDFVDGSLQPLNLISNASTIIGNQGENTAAGNGWSKSNNSGFVEGVSSLDLKSKQGPPAVDYEASYEYDSYSLNTSDYFSLGTESEPQTSQQSSSNEVSLVLLENEPVSDTAGRPISAAEVYSCAMYSSEEEVSESEDNEADVWQKDTEGLSERSNSSLEDGELNEDAVDAMLEGIDGLVKKDKSEKIPLITTVEKFFIVERSNQLFEFLPEGWLKVIHQSGIPIYFYRETRICTLSRPYGLGIASLRGHRIPVSAIPCLDYRRAKDEAEKKEEAAAESCPVIEMAEPASEAVDVFKSAKVLTADEHLQKSLLSAAEVRQYCSKVFDFQSKIVRRFSSWKVGRGRQRLMKKIKHEARSQKHTANNSDTQNTEREESKEVTPSTMLKNAKVVTFERRDKDGKMKVFQINNPTSKTPVSLLTEFVQHVLKIQPEFKILDVPDASAPYQCVVLVDKKEEGKGVGTSKKAAKDAAAAEAILKMAPELRKILGGEKAQGNDEIVFRDIEIQDERVEGVCHKADVPKPFQLLTTALSRMQGSQHKKANFTAKVDPTKPRKNEYTMTVVVGTRTYSAFIVYEKKHEAKHLCAQKILQDMHPDLKYYGQLLELYGQSYHRKNQEKKATQRSITDLQAKGKWGEPNWELLEKLKEEMRKIKVEEGGRMHTSIRYD